MFKTSDISLWLHNKLGTTNDSWISGSICSQLNKEVLRNIKDCFPDLQTQVKLKLLLSFFHIPKRLVEEWKPELEEIIEVAGLDSELWVSMVAETMKTFPATGSLNTEITEYEETRPIFSDMVNDLKRLVTKNYDMSMLPLECQYLNKSALVSVVGQQAAPVKHFTMKRKPKSQTLRAELLQKSSDAQSSIKKVSAPTVPLRSRGMPRKMTDTTPMKGIPSRVPTSGFRSPPASQSQQRPSVSRTTAGRKDGGIKLLDITEQPLGYAAAKKRKRQQDLEEQAKKAQEAQSAQEANLLVKSEPNALATDVDVTPIAVPTTTPDYAAGLAPSTTVYSQPATPLPAVVSSTPNNITTSIKIENNQIISTNNNKLTTDMNDDMNDEDMSTVNIKMEPPPTPQLVSSIKMNVSDHKLMTMPTNVPKLASISSSSSMNVPQHSTIKIVKIEQPDTVPVLSASTTATLNKIMSMASTTITKPTTTTRTTFVPASSMQQTIIMNNNKTATIGGRTITFTSNTPPTSNVQQTTVPTPAKQPKLLTQENIKQEIKYVTKTISAPTIQKNQAGGQATITQENLQKILSQANLILTKTGTTNQVQQQQQPQQLASTSTIKSQQPLTQFTIQQQPQQQQQVNVQRIATGTTSLNITNMPTLTTTISRTQLQQVRQQQLQQQQQQSIQQQTQILTKQQQQPTLATITQKQQPTKIVQIKTAPTMQNLVSSSNASLQNIPPLIPTNQSYVLGAGGQRKTLTFTSQNNQSPNIIHTSLGQIQIQQQPQQPQTIQIQQQSVTQHQQLQQQQQPKYTQVMMSPNVNMKGKTIILANPSILNQKGVILRTVGPTGNTVYQQISGLSNLSGHTIIQQQGSGPPSLIKTNEQQTATTMPALIPTNQNIPSLTPVVIQSSGGQQQKGIPTLITNMSGIQQQQQQHQQHTLPQQTIIRPLSQGGQVTLIQRSGQQAQLVQTITQQSQQQQQQQPQRIIMTQPIQQQQPQTIHIQQVPQNQAQTIQIQPIVVQQQQQAQQQQPQQQPQTQERKGLSLSNKHVMEAHDMFKRANRVTRLEKALILAFMAGYRDNPRPNPDNVVVIKLNESKENVKQEDNTIAVMLVESLIRLDYNTGEWKTFRKYRKLDQNQQVDTPMSTSVTT